MIIAPHLLIHSSESEVEVRLSRDGCHKYTTLKVWLEFRVFVLGVVCTPAHRACVSAVVGNFTAQ